MDHQDLNFSQENTQGSPPSPCGYKTPPTPSSFPTQLNDQIPDFTLPQPYSPLFQYSSIHTGDTTVNTLEIDLTDYPLIFSTPPTAFPDASTGGKSQFEIAQSNQHIYSYGMRETTITEDQNTTEQKDFLTPSPFRESWL